MLILTAPKAKTYDPSPCCIYCGTTDPEAPRSLEHIIPYALDGDLEYPDAVCPKCQKPTWWVEDTLLRGDEGMFTAARIHLGVRTRNPKERPSSLQMGVTDPFVGGPPNMEEVNFRWRRENISNHPGAIVLPILPPPGIYSNRMDPDLLVVPAENFQHRLLNDFPPSIFGERHMALTPIHVEAFPRLMAKMAHGLAVAELGFDAFEPLLPDYILRRRHDYARILGTAHAQIKPSDQLVTMALYRERGFFVARIQLFPQFNYFKPYTVVIGQPKDTDTHSISPQRKRDRRRGRARP